MTNSPLSAEHSLLSDPWHKAPAFGLPKGFSFSSKIHLLDPHQNEESSGHMVILLSREEGKIRTSIYALLTGCGQIQNGKSISICDTLVQNITKDFPQENEECELIRLLQTTIEKLSREAIERLPVLAEYGQRKTYPGEVWSTEGAGHRLLKQKTSEGT